MKVFEDFIEYCKEDNKQLVKDIYCWLADYFDLSNREIPLLEEELNWIKLNLGEESQKIIFGEVVVKDESV